MENWKKRIIGYDEVEVDQVMYKPSELENPPIGTTGSPSRRVENERRYRCQG